VSLSFHVLLQSAAAQGSAPCADSRSCLCFQCHFNFSIRAILFLENMAWEMSSRGKGCAMTSWASTGMTCFLDRKAQEIALLGKDRKETGADTSFAFD